nr:hydroxyquinol 1,2-dioxygenase [Sphingobium cloacae]
MQSAGANALTQTEILPIDNQTGYRAFQAGSFVFRRDDYFARISWPGGTHTMPVDIFLRALMRDVAWGFFYGVVNFDDVIGTINHYGDVTLFAGRFNDAYRNAGRDFEERFASEALMPLFKAMISDWTNEGFDPFAAPMETGLPWGSKNGNNDPAVNRTRVAARRMVGLPGDTPLRTDESGFPVNRMFADVPTDEPVIEAEPGFEDEVSAYNLFNYLARSDVTWNPSVCSVVGDSLFCPTSEEFTLPVDHGNDRCEWFITLSDEIVWDIKDKETGKPRAKVVAKAGDVSCMPADIRHKGYADKRAMLLVWENASPKIPELITQGKAPVVSVTF